jgi:hypothetical protein
LGRGGRGARPDGLTPIGREDEGLPHRRGVRLPRCDTRSHGSSELADWRDERVDDSELRRSVRRSVPTLTCVAVTAGFEASGEKPKGPRSIRGTQARGRPDG